MRTALQKIFPSRFIFSLHTKSELNFKFNCPSPADKIGNTSAINSIQRLIHFANAHSIQIIVEVRDLFVFRFLVLKFHYSYYISNLKKEKKKQWVASQIIVNVKIAHSLNLLWFFFSSSHLLPQFELAYHDLLAIFMSFVDNANRIYACLFVICRIRARY